MLCCSPCRARVGYLCVAGRWCSLGCVCRRSTSDALEGVCTGVGWTSIFVSPTAGIFFCSVGIVAGCGRPGVVRPFCTDADVSKIVASFLRAARQSARVAVANNSDRCLSALTRSFADTSTFVVADNFGPATSIGKNCAVAQTLVPPIDGTENL